MEWNWEKHLAAYVASEEMRRRNGGVDAYRRAIQRIANFAGDNPPTACRISSASPVQIQEQFAQGGQLRLRGCVA